MFCIVYLAPLLCTVMTMLAPLHPLNNVRRGVGRRFNGAASAANARIKASKKISSRSVDCRQSVYTAHNPIRIIAL